MTTQNFTATPTAPSQSSWIQQLWQKVTAPIGNSPKSKRAEASSKVHGSTLTSESRINARGSELAPSPAIIGTQTTRVFSDQTNKYEPADLALTDLIPTDLALLNILPTRPAVPNSKEATTHQTEAAPIPIEVINVATAAEEFDCDNDNEYLAVLVSAELSDLSEEIEKNPPRSISFLTELLHTSMTALALAKTAVEISGRYYTDDGYHQFCSAPSPNALPLNPPQSPNKPPDRSPPPSAH